MHWVYRGDADESTPKGILAARMQLETNHRHANHSGTALPHFQWNLVPS
jgi:hypothetical protein